MGRYAFRDDIVLSDCAVEVWGDSLADLLETAARSLAELMADPSSVAERRSTRVALEAESADLLLVEWLGEILFLKDRDRTIYPRAEVRVTGGAGRDRGAGDPASPLRLEATLHGDVVDPETTRRGIDVKAVTLHRLLVERGEDGWHGHFVVDL